MTNDIDNFRYAIQVQGCVVLKDLATDELSTRMREDVFYYYERNRELQVRAGFGESAKWGAHHLCGRNDGIHEFLESDVLDPYLSTYFNGKPYIINSIGGSINAPPAEGRYEHGHRWHRDIRTFVGLGNRQLAVALVMLDNFTIENGATEVLLGSHTVEEFPPDSFVAENRKQVTGRRGSVILYDGDVWHKVGENRSADFRVALTLVFTRPYFKQQLDYPRYLDPQYAESLSPRMRQLFGFNARTPSSMEEWYQPAGNRFYKSDQE